MGHGRVDVRFNSSSTGRAKKSRKVVDGVSRLRATPSLEAPPIRRRARTGWGREAPRGRAPGSARRRGRSKVKNECAEPEGSSRAPSHAPSADRADRAAPPDARKAQMRIILKRYRRGGPRPAAIASRAKPWIPSSRVYTRGRTWSRPRARGARCGARGGTPRRA